MMAPTLATSAEGARFAIGSGGSNRIRTAVLQVLVNLLDVGLPMAAATEAARLHIEGEAVANIEAAGVEGCWPGEAQSLLAQRSEEHTSELQSLMRSSYAVFCLTKKKQQTVSNHTTPMQRRKLS